jgi:hypothetical protein
MHFGEGIDIRNLYLVPKLRDRMSQTKSPMHAGRSFLGGDRKCLERVSKKWRLLTVVDDTQRDEYPTIIPDRSQ